VPEIADVTELYQLDNAQRMLLMEESCYLAENLAELFNADKMNVANIGNIVSQLHIHHIVRYQIDIAWPVPVWGKFAPVPYTDQQITKQIKRIESCLIDRLKL
jgi:diadenosine tetraphosphate (Ap4A) HIT family hydrolase